MAWITLPAHGQESERAAALAPELDALEPAMLTALREAVADAEERAWRRTAARRVRALAPGPYAVAVFTAVVTKQWPDQYSDQGVELYTQPDYEDWTPAERLDLTDPELTRALDTLSALLHLRSGDELAIELDPDASGEPADR